AINSLTLSPALAAALLKPHGAKPDVPARIIDRLFGWIFRPFNRFFLRSASGYEKFVGKSLSRRGLVFAIYLVLLAGTGWLFNQVPGGFIPTQDKTYLVGNIRLPEGASINRTEAVARRVSDLAMETGIGRINTPSSSKSTAKGRVLLSQGPPFFCLVFGYHEKILANG